VDITVVLCTYNRCHSLAETLSSIAASKLPESVEWEILVVDNNSSDQTRAVVRDISGRHPGRFRYLFEPQPGKSHALNSGVREARGKILAFTDDDVKVEPTWLQNLTAGLHNCDWAGSGGKIDPEWSSPPPRWLPTPGPHALAPLTVFDRGLKAGPLPENPYGANMAFRKEMFERYGGFRTDLGPLPGSQNPQKNEDSQFGSRLLAAGEKLRYEPSAVVYHPVQEHRIKKQYFLSWWFDKGRSDIRSYGVRPGTKYFASGIPLYMFRGLAVGTIKWMFTVEHAARFSRKLEVWQKAGEILECYREAIDAKRAGR
jgi:glucosyl-dolichyl phosphate glucuronosyltransferase